MNQLSLGFADSDNAFSLYQVLHETFPDHTFLKNGLIQSVKVRIF